LHQSFDSSSQYCFGFHSTQPFQITIKLSDSDTYERILWLSIMNADHHCHIWYEKALNVFISVRLGPKYFTHSSGNSSCNDNAKRSPWRFFIFLRASANLYSKSNLSLLRITTISNAQRQLTQWLIFQLSDDSIELPFGFKLSEYSLLLLGSNAIFPPWRYNLTSSRVFDLPKLVCIRAKQCY